MCRSRERHTHSRVDGRRIGHTGAVMSRLLVIAVVMSGGLFAGCSSGERSCSELRAELQQVTGGTSVDVSQRQNVEQVSDTATKELQLRDEIGRRCG